MKVRVCYEVRHSLGWSKSYEEQADQLGERFTDDLIARPGTYVLIGHSNGGRVSRYMAQNRGGANVRGVVTVSSPHAGAYLANIGQTILTAAVAVPIAHQLFGCDIASTYICSQGAGMAASIGAVVGPYMLQGIIPVTKQTGTNAPFIDTINSRGDVVPTAGAGTSSGTDGRCGG
ncbi:MAG: Palmitoyl protein thioesterase [Gemmatimonadetes bacterium]|nr:Palmitoyl protein thioesterase [Gemmatimonadota bacterium]